MNNNNLQKIYDLLNKNPDEIYIEIYGDGIEIKDKYNEKIVRNAFINEKIHSIYLECEAKSFIENNKQDIIDCFNSFAYSNFASRKS